MEDIRTLAQPAQVGKFYSVPHIKIKAGHKYYSLAYYGLWMPILGDIHEDPEISNDLGAHVHPDWRFVPHRVICRLGERVKPNIVITSTDIEIKSPVMKRRKMLREFTFPDILCKVLEPIYVGKNSGCAKCPHRGISLGSQAPDGDGCVICPGHGLKVVLKTGEVVKRGRN